MNTRERKESYQAVLLDRRLLACPECGWVHYVMTPEEKAVNDQRLERLIERYQLSEGEQGVYQGAFRQCLYCEAPVSTFRVANERDLGRAEGHMVTPVFVGPEVGTH